MLTKVDVHGLIHAGDTVTDIGQLSDKAKRWLGERVAAGEIETFTSNRFPQPKSAYRMASAFFERLEAIDRARDIATRMGAE